MDLPDNNYLLIILGIVAVTLEVVMGAATGFDLLLVGFIFIISGGLGLFLHSFQYALMTVAILSFLYVFFGRKFIKSKLSVTTTKTNTEKLVGATATVTKKITPNHPGQVKLDGAIWRASAESPIEVGERVTVESVSGVTLAVQKN